MQRQLQLRIEAQGKYLKKIIEEQKRLSGVLSELPASGVHVPGTQDIRPESENKTDPGTPAASSEPPFVDKEHNPSKSLSVNDSHEPQTPDSDSHLASPVLGPNEKAAWKH